jgi:hypothetical protein
MKVLLRFWCWAKWKLGLRPPWVNLPPLDPWSSTEHGEHKVEAVSRHAIAETGLICPKCLNEICPRGDFTQVREGKIGAIVNEVIICHGQREVRDHKIPCGAILMASPDTEHGDNILWDKVPTEERKDLFFRFRRISEDQALKEKYGFDVSLTKEGQMRAKAEDARDQPKENRDRVFFELDDVYVLSNGRMGHVTELLAEHEGDKHFVGWCIMEIDGDGVRWFVDPFGTVRRDMTDPTMNNLVIVHKQQKV